VSLTAYGQTAPKETAVDEKENEAILELGGATSRDISGGAPTWAPNFAVEIEPVENWLEL